MMYDTVIKLLQPENYSPEKIAEYFRTYTFGWNEYIRFFELLPECREIAHRNTQNIGWSRDWLGKPTCQDILKFECLKSNYHPIMVKDFNEYMELLESSLFKNHLRRVTINLYHLFQDNEENKGLINRACLLFISYYDTYKAHQSSPRLSLRVGFNDSQEITLDGKKITVGCYPHDNWAEWNPDAFLLDLSKLRSIENIQVTETRLRLPTENNTTEATIDLSSTGFSMPYDYKEENYFSGYGVDDFLEKNPNISTISFLLGCQDDPWNRFVTEDFLFLLERKGPYPGVKTLNFPSYPMHLPRLKEIFPNLEAPLLCPPGIEEVDSEYVGEEGEDYYDSLEKAKHLFPRFRTMEM